ncbi:MAG: TonB family protein, partial [Acidobacteria bacterium]|nr:TonB family protein [Acidobacteriota bacterium]
LERSYYIAMEYIDGKDLRTILRALEDKGGRMPLGLALLIGARLAAALDYAHRKRDLQGQAMALVHRDVSPQNVLISYDGDIKLCDFGIAKAASKASHTRAGALKGKLQYMSPEQAWGKDIDQRSDIFSLGLVFYEMLTGRKAFAGDSELSILEQVRAPKLTPPREMDPSTPPEVERVVLKALQTDRDDRYQTAAEMARELANILQSLRPAPGASELGSFLSDLVGRERQAPATSAPPVRPGVTATPLPAPKPTPSPAPPAKAKGHKAQPKPAKPAPRPKVVPKVEVEEEIPEISQIIADRKRIPPGLLIGGGIAAVALIAAVLLMTGDTKSATQTTPEMLELARQTAQAEVTRQESQLRERLTRESGGQAAAAGAPDQAPEAVSGTAGATTQARATLAPTIPPRGTTAPAPHPTLPAAEPTQVPAQAQAPAQAIAGAPEDVPTLAPPPPPTAAMAAPVATRAPLVSEQPSVHQGDLVEMSGDVTPPQLLASPRPQFPPLARRQRSPGGLVIVKLLIDENGSVADAQVLRAPIPDYGYSRAALDAVKQWRYKPATKAGVRVKTHTMQTIVFSP